MQIRTSNVTAWAIIEKQASNTKHFTDFRGFTDLTVEKLGRTVSIKTKMVVDGEEDILHTEYLLII